MNGLKRCPFCGDEVEIAPTGLYHWKYAICHKSKTECILDAKAFAVPYEEEDAVRMWNTRVDRKTEPSGGNLSPVGDEPQKDCNGCKFVGTYDTEFPCANCSRKTKDYYAKDEPQTVTDEDLEEVGKAVARAKAFKPNDIGEPLTKCDLCKREGDDVCLDCERNKQSGKE